MSPLFFVLFSLLIFALRISSAQALTLSSRLIHRFSDEATEALLAVPGGAPESPPRHSHDYYRLLIKRDFERQKRRIANVKFQKLFPVEGSHTYSPGNDFGWLHYTWIDIGTPNASFLVALDTGSDLLWVPCDCIQCAPLSGYSGSLDKDLGMYNPGESRTSRHLPCSHELCHLGASCKSLKQPCPYTVNYYSENTSSSGLLVEDTLYLATSGGHTSVQTPVVIGWGRRQSGDYLDGIAPDGVLGLGFGNISVPSVLARSGLVHNSFSMCFQEDDSGRIFFGDRGVSTQQSTPFVPWEGKYITYIVEVESFCIKSRCLGKTSFQALVDSGSSFTFLPDDVYRRVTLEFDRQVNASSFVYDDWEYCYQASQLEMPAVPTLTVMLAINQSFVITNPIFLLHDKKGEIAGFCLALHSSSTESPGTIGQNLMMGYKMVFDRENLKLGWLRSNCQDVDNSSTVPLTPAQQNRTGNPLPTNEQQSSPGGRAVSPAVAGRAPTTAIPSSAILQVLNQLHSTLLLLAHLTVVLIW